MKFIIAVDLEGVACTVGAPNNTLNSSPQYEFARIQATREANAAARALFDAGAEQVIIWDTHGSSLNLHYNDLDKRCDILLGVNFEHSWPTLDQSFSGVLMVGYHPMDNTPNGVIAHTYSSTGYQWVKVNGTEVGEIAIHAMVAGEFGVPVIFVASDDKGTAEAKRFLPWVETVATKKGLGWNLALSKHPARVLDEIYEGVRRGVARLQDMKPLSYNAPLKLEMRYKRLENAQNTVREKEGWSLVDPYTVEKTFERLSDFY